MNILEIINNWITFTQADLNKRCAFILGVELNRLHRPKRKMRINLLVY
jgi:hypothetical protein